MFKTFNMGWGFGIIVDKKEIDKAMNTLEKGNIKPEIIGKVTNKQTVEIKYQNKKLSLIQTILNTNNGFVNFIFE